MVFCWLFPLRQRNVCYLFGRAVTKDLRNMSAMPLHLAKILLYFRQSACRVHPLLPIAMIDRRIPPDPDQTLATTRVRAPLEGFIIGFPKIAVESVRC